MNRYLLAIILVFTIIFPISASAQTPHNKVGNTNFKMFNAITAEEANTLYQEGLQAIVKCDKAKYWRVMMAYPQFIDQVWDYGDTTSDLVESISQGLFKDPDHSDSDVLGEMKKDLEKKWNAVQPCGEDKEELNKKINIAMGAFFGVARQLGIHGYLAAEVTGMPATREFGVVKQDRTSGTSGIEASIRIALGDINDAVKNIAKKKSEPEKPKIGDNFADLYFGIRHADADNSDVTDSFSTGGRDLLLPGVGAGPNPAGFSIGAANSDVTGISYMGDYSFNSYEFGFGKTFYVPQSGASVRPFVGVEYGRSESSQMFSATTNAGATDFSYTTNIKNKYVGPVVGVEASTRFDFLSNLLNVPVDLGGSARYAYVFNHAEGNDTLAVTGFTPGTANIEQSENTHNIKAGVNVTVKPTDFFSLTFGGNFERIGNATDVTRTGTRLSDLTFENAHNFTGTVRGTLSF